MSCNKFKHIIDVINIKTLRINFKYFKFWDAIKLPILVSRRVHLKRLKGQIRIDAPLATGMIKIGIDSSNIIDHRNERSILYIEGVLNFKGKVTFGSGCKIQILPDAVIEIGPNSIITARTALYCSNRIKLGAECLLSWDVLLMDSDHHNIFNTKKQIINSSKPIVLGDQVWVGCRATILKGSTIAMGSVIASGALVVGDLNEQSAIYAGVPAKMVKQNITWKLN